MGLTGTEVNTLEVVWAQLDQYRVTPLPASYPGNIRHLFSPVDQVHQALVALCNGAATSLAAAMYGWDDDEIDALFRTKLETDNIPVTLSLDSSQAGGVHEKAILAKWPATDTGNVIAIGQSSKHAISHDKMIVIDGLITICGSTNFSTSGETLQNNEAVVVYDAVFAAESRARIDCIHAEMLGQMAAKARS
jgi:phosphatidylserine/phosphatidylglycerophosphate/cardiolipin synthase-like enzyme